MRVLVVAMLLGAVAAIDDPTVMLQERSRLSLEGETSFSEAASAYATAVLENTFSNVLSEALDWPKLKLLNPLAMPRKLMKAEGKLMKAEGKLLKAVVTGGRQQVTTTEEPQREEEKDSESPVNDDKEAPAPVAEGATPGEEKEVSPQMAALLKLKDDLMKVNKSNMEAKDNREFNFTLKKLEMGPKAEFELSANGCQENCTLHLKKDDKLRAKFLASFGGHHINDTAYFHLKHSVHFSGPNKTYDYPMLAKMFPESELTCPICGGKGTVCKTEVAGKQIGVPVPFCPIAGGTYTAPFAFDRYVGLLLAVPLPKGVSIHGSSMIQVYHDQDRPALGFNLTWSFQ